MQETEVQPNKNVKSYTEVYSTRYPMTQVDDSHGVISKINSLKNSEVEDQISDFVEENNSNIITNIVQTIVQHSVDRRNNIFNNNIYRATRSDAFSNQGKSINSDGIIPLKNDVEDFDLLFQREDPHAPGVSSIDITKYLNSKELTSSYEYSFSIRNISFGLLTNNSSNKACFISNKIETNGLPIGIKAIANIVKERQDLNFFNLDLREPGSVELSICISEDIQSESSWVPVVHTLNNRIDSEVLFFNNLKQASLRFLAKASTIRMYKNGILENPNNWVFRSEYNRIEYSYTIDSNAIYVVEYDVDQTDYNQSVLDIDKIRQEIVNIKSYSKNGKQGQVFTHTGPGNNVKLEYIPFIENKFTTAVYNNYYGTVNTIENVGYSPIAVVFGDGSTAINLTNYLDNSFEKASFYSTDEYLFYQNGKEIIFNRAIDKEFTINYSYIPSVLRFRSIIRNNIPGQTNGISLDNVIIKSKVKNLDPFSLKLLRLN
jgi:hypothetical protein